MSNNNSSDNPLTRLHRERSFPDRGYSELRDSNMEWLANKNENVDHIVRIERLQREYHQEYAAMVAACENGNKRPVIAALLHHDGVATYNDLMEYTSISRRTVRNYAYELRDANVFTIEDGRPATVSFSSEAIEILTQDHLSKLYSAEE